MIAVAVAIALNDLGATGQALPPAGATVSRPASKFSKDSRQLLAVARAEGRSMIRLIAVAKLGFGPRLAERVPGMGGTVRYQADDVDYVRVEIPIGKVDEFAVPEMLETIAVDYGFTDNFLLMAEPGQGRPSGSNAASELPRLGDFPVRHPHSVLREIDADRFRTKHPTFDGRGVTIALLDGFVDFLLPELQTAYSLDGRRISKMADIINSTNPSERAFLDPSWVDMSVEVDAQHGRVTFHDKSFTTPRDGRFHIGIFDSARFDRSEPNEFGRPLRDPILKAINADGTFGVLWDDHTNDIWVDTNANLSFADEKPMRTFTERHEIGVFGVDRSSTPLRESIGFALQLDSKSRFLAINLGTYSHATATIGAVVGNPGAHGRIQGIAPGTRLVSIFHSGTETQHTSYLIEEAIMAFRHPQVDLIMLAGGPHLHLLDGHSTLSVVLERLTARYRKLLFTPAGNAPGIGIVLENGLSPAVIAAGAYQSRDSYRAQTTIVPEFTDNLHWGGLAHGPGANGSLKPDLLAPSGLISTYPGYRPQPPHFPMFRLPPGYYFGSGSSTAAPMATGAAAIVVSAAKQTGVPVDAERLKAALIDSTRYISRLPAVEQGNGLVQVEAAYELLKAMQQTPRVRIVSRAPVSTADASLLTPPNEGIGLYEREGWSVGDTRTRVVRLTRLSGPATPMIFTLSWLGNDGTFSSQPSVTLPLNTTVELSIAVSVKAAGVHSSILTLDNPLIPGHAHRLSSTVIAPVTFSRENGYTITTNLAISRPGDTRMFVRTTARTAALRFSVSAGVLDRIQLSAISPSHQTVGCPHAATTCVIERPEPGVWELNVCPDPKAYFEYDANRDIPLGPMYATLTASVLGAQITAAAPSEVARAGKVLELPVTISNQFSQVSGLLTSTSLGSAFHAIRTIAAGEQHSYDVVVPAGTTSLRAELSDVTGAGTELDLYFLDCTSRTSSSDDRSPLLPNRVDLPPPQSSDRAMSCVTRAKITSALRRDAEVSNPAPGLWRIVVDAFSVPEGHATYTYVDVFTNPRFGTLAPVDFIQRRDVGESWSATASLITLHLPEAPRQLVAHLVFTAKDPQSCDGSPVPMGVRDIPFPSTIRAEQESSVNRH